MSDYKKRREAAGYRFVGFWVTEQQEEVIRALLKGMDDLGMSPKVELKQRGGARKRRSDIDKKLA